MRVPVCMRAVGVVCNKEGLMGSKKKYALRLKERRYEAAELRMELAHEKLKYLRQMADRVPTADELQAQIVGGFTVWYGAGELKRRMRGRLMTQRLRRDAYEQEVASAEGEWRAAYAELDAAMGEHYTGVCGPQYRYPE